MRDIKFRIWNKVTKRFNSKMDLIIFGSGSDWYISESNAISQYTGLKDKNDKEIYEGDIVKISNKIGQIKIGEWCGEYYYANDTYGPYCEFSDGRQYGLLRGSAYEPTVIGNIYENPELLGRELK